MSRSEGSAVENGKYKEDSSKEVMEANTSMVCFMFYVIVVVVIVVVVLLPLNTKLLHNLRCIKD